MDVRITIRNVDEKDVEYILKLLATSATGKKVELEIESTKPKSEPKPDKDVPLIDEVASTILKLTEVGKEYTKQDIFNAVRSVIDASESTIYRALRRLIKRGEIKRVKSGVYVRVS
jgi:hypothetical protein